MSAGQGPAPLSPPAALPPSTILLVSWLNYPKPFSVNPSLLKNEHPSPSLRLLRRHARRSLSLAPLSGAHLFPSSPSSSSVILYLFFSFLPLLPSFSFFLFSHPAFLIPFPSPPSFPLFSVSLMWWRDRKGTGFIVKSRTYRTIQTHTHTY